jgi:hypothetical protein
VTCLIIGDEIVIGSNQDVGAKKGRLIWGPGTEEGQRTNIKTPNFYCLPKFSKKVDIAMLTL